MMVEFAAAVAISVVYIAVSLRRSIKTDPTWWEMKQARSAHIPPAARESGSRR
jgi:hypothetical protein